MADLRTDNLNIERAGELSPPVVIKQELPLTVAAADTVIAARAGIENILMRRDPRLLVVLGPCSIHEEAAALDFAGRVKVLQEEVAETMLLVMRAYFEKPRTTLGWKGLIYDPQLDDSADIEGGLRMARRILLGINEIGVPAATEMLEPVVPQYITDLVSWAAIGARTAESQTHRQLASGLSMPIGFKNATDGNIRRAVEAVRTARSSHVFLGVTEVGRVGLFHTLGNPFGHLILRGGTDGPNYGSEYLAYATELMRKCALIPNIMVDCSHGNSGKRPEQQPEVCREVVNQILDGQENVRGLMLESHVAGGRQDVTDGLARLRYGVSITDPCLDWETTAATLREQNGRLREVLGQRRPAGTADAAVQAAPRESAGGAQAGNR